jgi:hypothetical protein
MKKIAIGLMFGIVICFGSVQISYGYVLEKKCGWSGDIFKYALKGVSPKFVGYTIRKGERGLYVLFISEPAENNDQEGWYQPWRLLKNNNADDMCLIFAGDRVEHLGSLHDTKPEQRYGMPGSGYQRCTEYDASALDHMDVRLWANKELGKSLTMHLHSEIGEKNLTFLRSFDDHWIFIESAKNSVGTTCYYDRGDNIRQPMILEKTNEGWFRQRIK